MKSLKCILAAVLISALVASCATTGQSPGVRKNSLPAISEEGVLADGDGILLMSAGRKRKAAKEDGTNFAGILPFISYHILRKTDDQEYEELAFIPAEAGLSNQLGKDYYGFIHYRELPSGDYVAVGNESRGQSLYGGGMTWTPGNRSTEIAFEFSIEAGKINYIGELVTMRGFLQSDDVQVLDKHARDVAFLQEKHKETNGFLVDIRLAKPTSIDEMPVPEILQ